MILSIENSIHLYNANGKKGDDGAHGRPGLYYGARGQDGAAGHRGEDGHTLIMGLSVSKNDVKVQANNCFDSFPLSDRSISIAMQSRGADGGHGGDAGEGANGYKGANGIDASRKHSAGDGHNGGAGGNGGNGGAGGNGGNGGEVIVNVHPDDADLLMLISTPDTCGGKKGTGGSGAPGGVGGCGGVGGDFAVWTSYSYINDKTKLRFRPGGSDGSPGPDGEDGIDGADGEDGLPGSFTICMGGKKFSRPYDLTITSCDLTEPNNNGIFEPQQLVSAHITLRNNGGMELPCQQVTRVTITDNNYLRFDPNSTIFLPRALGAGQSHTPANPLQFRINDFPTAINEPLNVKTCADFSATVARVERQFEEVENQVRSFVIRYPAQMEKVTGVTSISIDEEALMSVRLNNISEGHLGLVSDAHRIVTLKYRVLPNGETTASDVCFFSKAGEQCTGASGLTTSVDHLPPLDNTAFSGSLKFANPNLRPYTRVKIGVSLALGALTAPDNEQSVKTVQCREFEVQLSDLYRYNPKADFLLVTNANTQRSELDHWHSMSAMLGLTFSTWNCSLYNGISFYRSQPVPKKDWVEPVTDSRFVADQPCLSEHTTTRQCVLAEHFANKTAVFLNYPAPDEKSSTDTLPTSELFHCAQAPYGLKFYTVGKAVNRKDQVLPDRLGVENVRTIPLTERYYLFKNASKNRLQKMALKHANHLRRQYPDRPPSVVYHYENKKLPGRTMGGRKQCLVGGLKVCFAPSGAMFVHRPMDAGKENQIHTVFSEDNIFGLLKSLPMAKKLELVNTKSRDYNEDLRATLKKVILSDLADEHGVFSQDRWAGPMSKKQLNKRLTTLRQVVNADYESPHAQEFILETLQEFRAFARRMPRKRDLLPNRRQRILSSVTRKMIDKCVSRYYLDEKHWKSGYRAQKEFFKSIPREELWQKYNQEGIIRPLSWLNGCDQVLDLNEDFLQSIYDNPHPDTVVEQGHIYRSQEARCEALERLEATGKALPDPEPLPGASGSV